MLSKGEPAIQNFAKGSRTQITVRTFAPSRGRLNPWPLLIYSEYPLGLFRIQSQLHLDLACIVYPKPKIGAAKTTAEKSGDELDGGRIGSGTDDFQGLKSYRPGDPLQRISWKASSRGRGLFIKDFNGLYGASFFLDWHRLEGFDTEHRLSVLCHAVLKAQQNNLKYGLKLPGKTIKPGNGEIHKNRCLKTLALFEPGALRDR
jgi:uncharacterized protein (DUF58 family)